jgi:NAD(P)-dependent dehydrogenase (short-subunit alcohol dehydrogenase family)
VNNAGVLSPKRQVTAEGHERTLATNLLSPLALSEALLPALQAAAPSRIVMVGSSSSDRARIDPDNLELARGWSMTRAYSQSKLALLMTSRSLAKRLELYACLSPEMTGKTGLYLKRRRPAVPNPLVENRVLADRVTAAAEKLLS